MMCCYRRIFLAVNVVPDTLVPAGLVSLIYGVNGTPLFDTHVGIRQHKFADSLVCNKNGATDTGAE